MTDDPSRTISFLRKPFTPGELLEKVSTLLTLSRTHLNQFPA
jgi:DNA-binding response OmpR family regulator